MEQEPQEERKFMTKDSPEIQLLREGYGGLLEAIVAGRVKVPGGIHGWVGEHDGFSPGGGIRVPFDRKKAKERAQRMRESRALDEALDQILSDEP